MEEEDLFTIHFATINTPQKLQGIQIWKDLQYTLLLLILNSDVSNNSKSLLFTIHFATINTCYLIWCCVTHFIFTIHFATINTSIFSDQLLSRLRFTIHFATINTENIEINGDVVLKFTIHFATINTSEVISITTCHSTIYNTLCYY